MTNAVSTARLFVLCAGLLTGCVKTNTLAPDLDDAVLENITQRLQGEYTNVIMRSINQRAPSSVDAERLLQVGKVVLTDVKLRRSPRGSIVRVTPIMAGGPPPDDRVHRYYEVMYNTVGGWRVKREASKARFDRLR